MTRVELCWDCHNPLGGDYVTYLPAHYQIIGGSQRRAHPGCVPDGAFLVREVECPSCGHGEKVLIPPGDTPPHNAVCSSCATVHGVTDPKLDAAGA